MAGLYFPHDLTARNDPKIIKLLKTFGMEGYGIYWALLEMLGSNSEHKLPIAFEDYAWELRTETLKIAGIVQSTGLFIVTDDGKYFYSERLLQHFESIDETRQKRSKAGRKGMESRWASDNKPITNVINSDNKPITNVTDFITEKQEKQEKENKQEKACLLAQAKEKEKQASEQAAKAELFLDTETYSPIVTELANEIAVKFGYLQAMPIHRQKVMKLIQAIHTQGTDTAAKIREGLSKLDTAEAITQKKIDFTIDHFLFPDTFCKLVDGYYDKIRKRGTKTTPDLGVSFEELGKKGFYDRD